MSAGPASPRETVARFLAAVVSPTPGDMADCYANRVIIEMPFAAGPIPERLENTREEIRQRFAAGTAARRYTAVRDVRVHETADPDVLVIEYTLDGTRIADGGQFTMRFVMVLTFRDGLIVHSRDYTDPIAGARALGRLPELAAMLAADAQPTASGRFILFQPTQVLAYQTTGAIISSTSAVVLLFEILTNWLREQLI